jgi:hypothetical protein
VRSGALGIAALILLPIGGLILPVIGWFIGGILLWSSRVWTTGEKLAGTLLFPGRLLSPARLTLGAVAGKSCSGVIQNTDQLVTGSSQDIVISCHGPSTLYKVGGAILMAVLVIVPIAMAIVLACRMRARMASA